MEHKFYVNSLEFYRDVQKLIPSLNLNKSLRLLDQSFYIEDEYQGTPLLNLALGKMNEVIGKEVFNTTKSLVYNEQYTIFFPNGIAMLEGNVVEPVAEVIVEESTEVGKEPDWEWVESLKNVKADKEALDKYAEDEFEIKLNKSNTLKNMVVAFKKAL